MKVCVSSWSFAKPPAAQGRLLFSMGWWPGVWCLEPWSFQHACLQTDSECALGKALSLYCQDIQWKWKWEHLQTVAPRENLWLCRGNLLGWTLTQHQHPSGCHWSLPIHTHPLRRVRPGECVPCLSSSWGLCWCVSPIISALWENALQSQECYHGRRTLIIIQKTQQDLVFSKRKHDCDILPENEESFFFDAKLLSLRNNIVCTFVQIGPGF